MNTRKILFLSIYLSISILLFNGCKGKMNGGGGTLNIHESADPDMLNPINSSSANARTIIELIFSQLTGSEVTGEYNLMPLLTKDLAKVTELKEGEFKGGMRLDYEIKEDATWDNGSPITGHDYVFTIKTILNPKTNCEHLKSYYDWVGDIVVDSTNPKKFSVFSNKIYFKIEEFAGYYVIPEYNYDPNKLMRKFTIRELQTDAKMSKKTNKDQYVYVNNKLTRIGAEDQVLKVLISSGGKGYYTEIIKRNVKPSSSLRENPDILKFANEFNSEKYQRDPKYISGFGPYKLDHWTTGQEIVLVKKENWWGEKYNTQRDFWAFPKKIKIKIINDQNTSLTVLKDGQLDAYASIPAKDYKELEKNDKFKSKFDLTKMDRFSYSFIGINLRNDKFKDINVRKALAHAINRNKINEIISFGESKLTESFAHPLQPVYNTNLKAYEFDLAKAGQMLDAAGWKDTDGDGIRDKVLNGKKTPFIVEFKYPKNENTKNTCLIIQEDMKKLGVDFKLVEKEWTVYLQEQDKLQFEMFMGGFTIPERISDPKQIWHTDNAKPGGDNKTGWGNSVSDQLIDKLISDLNAENRKKYYMQLQQMIHDDVPVIFMFNAKNRIATSNKYEVEKILSNPGYKIQEFKLVK
jgi:peptide/nickel transport system substrate-binding protein